MLRRGGAQGHWEGAAIRGGDLMWGGWKRGLGGVGAVQTQLHGIVNVLHALLVLEVGVLVEEALLILLALKEGLTAITANSLLILIIITNLTLVRFFTRV